MTVFTGGSAGVVIELRCPACGEVQARARAPEGTVYACRKCGHAFTREEGRPPGARARRTTRTR